MNFYASSSFCPSSDCPEGRDFDSKSPEQFGSTVLQNHGLVVNLHSHYKIQIGFQHF